MRKIENLADEMQIAQEAGQRVEEQCSKSIKNKSQSCLVTGRKSACQRASRVDQDLKETFR